MARKNGSCGCGGKCGNPGCGPKKNYGSKRNPSSGANYSSEDYTIGLFQGAVEKGKLPPPPSTSADLQKGYAAGARIAKAKPAAVQRARCLYCRRQGLPAAAAAAAVAVAAATSRRGRRCGMRHWAVAPSPTRASGATPPCTSQRPSSTRIASPRSRPLRPRRHLLPRNGSCGTSEASGTRTSSG